MTEFVGFLIALFVRVVDAIMGLFGILQAGERHLAENARVGESPMEQKSRRWWDRLQSRWFWISLILLGLAATLVRQTWW